MIEVPVEISQMLRAMVPQVIGQRAIIDSRSVYDHNGDFRAFITFERTSANQLSLFYFDVSDKGEVLREDYVIITSANLTTFHLTDHETFKSRDAICGRVDFSHLESMKVEGKPWDDSIKGPALIDSSEALLELEFVIQNAWKHQQSKGRFTGA